MKERPILFSGEMARALLDGRKTQTRRAVKGVDVSNCCTHQCGGKSRAVISRCPYGKPGERLWVKETHLPKASGIIYRADFEPLEAAGLGGIYGGWKPSIFCRREYSRITIENVSVRVERLRDISEADALAEGCDSILSGGYEPASIAIPKHRPATRNYCRLWETINGHGSWEKNPWVWVIEFKQI